MATASLFTVPGLPSIYYGDEQAFRGEKGTGFAADDAIRPELPDSPESLSPAGWWLYRVHQELIALRRRNPWLTRGHLEVLDKTNETLRYRVGADGHELVATIDLVGSASFHADIDGQRAFTWPS